MGNCKDCKFWKLRNDGFTKWNVCDKVDWVDHGDVIKDDGFAIYAEALDDSGLEAGFKTGPMFGCVQFTPKT